MLIRRAVVPPEATRCHKKITTSEVNVKKYASVFGPLLIRDANVQDETTSLHFAGLINFTLTLQFDYATRKYRITENKNFLCNMRYSPSVLYVVAPDAKTLSPFRL